MELCDLNLGEYLSGKRELNAKDSSVYVPGNMVFIPEDGPILSKLQNVWMIMFHIAEGLKFIHAHKYVHRDLKPRNGKTWIILLGADISTLFSTEESMENCRLRSFISSNFETRSHH